MIRKSLSILLLSIIILPLITNSAQAYDESELSLTWNYITNAIVLDSDRDGYADRIYNGTTSGQWYNFTKQLGATGQTSLNVDMTGSYAGDTYGTNHMIGAYGDRILVPGHFLTASTCMYNISWINSTDGTLSSNQFGKSITSNGALNITCRSSATTGINGEPILQSSLERNNNPATNGFAMTNSSGDIYSYSTSDTGPKHTWFSAIFAGGDMTNADAIDIGYQQSTDALPGTSTQLSGHVIMKGNGVRYINGTIKTFFSSIPNAAPFGTIDRNIDLYMWGLLMPKEPPTSTYYSSLLPTITDDWRQVFVLLHPEIMNPSLKNEYARFIFDDGTNQYLMYMSGTTLYYASISSSMLDNRAYGFFLLDEELPIFSTTQSNTALTSQTYEMFTPITTITTNSTGISSIISGYKITPSSSLSRTTDPIYDGQTAFLQPLIIGETASQSSLIMDIKNAPALAAIQIRDSASLNGKSYIWTMDQMLADKSFTVDLPAAKCVDVYLKNRTTNSTIWSELGTLCNSGTMPKQLVYSENLSFIFWTLPWGTSTAYDAPNDIVETTVRHETTPFTYNIRIYDRNGTLAITDQQVASSVDTQSYNLTSVQKPARIEILDENNSTLHFVNVGNANYFQSIQAFAATYLTVQGFNILAFMPLIFASMWTRNTVSMGTMMTVVMIATLVWFGLFSLPDVVLYLMVFIAAIGMIAYKLYN